MLLKELIFHDVKLFIEQWHYSKCVPKGHNIFFGWFDGNNELYTVANYGWGVNPYQEIYLTRITGLDVTRKNCLELKRLCRREPKLPIELTGFLSECHRELKSRGIKFIVSFSDPEYGHSGGIYRAASFHYLGKTNAEMHAVDADGNKVHRRFAYRHSRRNGISIQESREVLGLRRVKTQPKDRWLKILDKHLNRRFERKVAVAVPQSDNLYQVV